MHEGANEEFELGDSEHDAFLAPPLSSPQERRPNRITRYLPPRVRNILSKISKKDVSLTMLPGLVSLTVHVLQIVILILIGIIILQFLFSYKSNDSFTQVKVSEASLFLSLELANNLSGSVIPGYVLTYAPLVFLDKGDKFFPSDLAKHVSNTVPTLNFSTISAVTYSLTLGNLDTLNAFGGLSVSLASSPPLITLPAFLSGQRPDSQTLQTKEAVSCVVVVVEKENGIVDAFYLYFYSFNEGPSALGHQAGNHLGDWEHNMIRFQNGKPHAVWYSQHSYGAAYTYDCLEKVGSRPVVFSARGSHANYAISGGHDMHNFDERVPAHLVYDRTSQGPLWDPTLSAYYYAYNASSEIFTPAVEGTPDKFLYFQGLWGDDEYPDWMEGQENFRGFRKWGAGPTGPRYKHLERTEVCSPDEKKVCVVLESL